MPFKSEKQRRYLWANEPEIARDWTDTYGSRIKKDDGGIMDTKTIKGQPHMLAYITPGEAKDLQKLGGKKTLTKDGIPAYPPGMGDPAYSKSEQGGPPGGGSGGPGGTMYYDAGPKDYQPTKGDYKDRELRKTVRLDEKRRKEEKKDYKKLSFRQQLKQSQINRNKVLAMRKLGLMSGPKPGIWAGLAQGLGKVPAWAEDMTEEELNAIARTGPYLGADDAVTAKSLESGSELLGRVFKGGPFKTNLNTGGGDGQGGGYMGYPSYAAWLAAQGGGGGTKVAEVVEDTPSAFQASLTGTADSPDYYVGDNPLASNIAWGKQMGVDPRTMGLTSFAAHGGRIPAAFGGIMDTETGRRAYGLGSIFKKIGRAAKKVFKSPIGKAALIGLGGYWLGGGQALGGAKMFGTKFGKDFALKNLMQRKGIQGLLTKGGEGKAWDPWKLGIAGASLLPFFMGGKDEDEDDKFDYMGAKNAYADEIMRIKAGALAGTLDPNKFVYQGIKDGGRIGLEGGGDPLLREEYDKYVFEMEELGITPMSFEQFKAEARAGMYAGGQSTPSDYTMEDALMTTTQDKLGGITDVMKQADLNRQGSVGQFYAADGGRIGYAGGSGRPPITMGQIQAPPQMPGPQASQRPNPMPAPQPNRMAGMPGGMHPMMNPMMNRPMMDPRMRGNPMMGGRRMAQEGGLMDLGGMEKDYRQEGGFVPLGGEEKADDVPARLSKNEFVFTADAVRGAGDGDIDKGAEVMENIMKNLEQGGQISEETQGLAGAQEMFGVSERLSEVV